VPQISGLKSAFTEAIGVPADCDFETLAYGKTEGWDSVAHMALVAAIESKFDIMLDTDDVIALSSFPVTKRILTKYGVAFD
jgi:acyl carrier protein